MYGAIQIGGHVKVKFFEVDKHFWCVNLGQNWRSSLRSTENDLGLKVDIEDRALGWQILPFGSLCPHC